MKYFTLLFILLSSNLISARDHYVKKESALDCSKPQIVYSGPHALKVCGSDCIKVVDTNYNCKAIKIEKELVDNLQDPVYSKNDIESCSGKEDCESKLALACSDQEEIRKINAEFTESWCTKFLRYNQVESGKEIAVVDQIKKDEFDLEKQNEKNLELGIKAALERIDHGKRVIALLILRNNSKGLDESQIEQMNNMFVSIKGLLETGSLNTAKTKISGLIPDGTLVTNEDKVALIAEIEKFPGL